MRIAKLEKAITLDSLKLENGQKELEEVEKQLNVFMESSFRNQSEYDNDMQTMSDNISQCSSLEEKIDLLTAKLLKPKKKLQK